MDTIIITKAQLIELQRQVKLTCYRIGIVQKYPSEYRHVAEAYRQAGVVEELVGNLLDTKA